MLLANLSVVFKLRTGTLAVSNVFCTLTVLFDLVETEPLFVKTFSYFLISICRLVGVAFIFEALMQCRGSLVLLEWKTRSNLLHVCRTDRNKWLPPQN